MLLDGMARHPTISVLALSFAEFVDPSELPSRPSNLEVDVHSDYLASSYLRYYAGGGMWAIRREVFDRIGGFCERMRYAEDHDLALRLGTEPGFAMVNRPVLVGHRRHAARLSHEQLDILDGVRQLVFCEQSGRYPGGVDRAPERRRIIAQHVRAVSIGAFSKGRLKEVWPLYKQTFSWQLANRRLRYLLAAPAIGLWRTVWPGTP